MGIDKAEVCFRTVAGRALTGGWRAGGRVDRQADQFSATKFMQNILKLTIFHPLIVSDIFLDMCICVYTGHVNDVAQETYPH